MPALSFSKDMETGVYLACNQAFARYAGRETPAEVAGLTDYEIFDPVTAAHFVSDDAKAISMDTPYIFFEDVPDAHGDQRQFQTTKLKFTDETGRPCLPGMCMDVTEVIKARKENEQARTIRKKYVVLPTDLSRLRHLPEAVPQRDTPLRLYMGMRRQRRREAEDEQ